MGTTEPSILESSVSAAQIVLAILTIATSGVVSAIVTYKLNSRREDRHFRRQRLEHLYKAYMRFCRLLGSHWLPYQSVMEGKLDYNQALDQLTGIGKDDPHSLEEVEMLVAIYWPELRAHIEALKELRDEASSTLAEHRRRYLGGKSIDPESLATMGEISKRLDSLESEFAQAVRAEAAKLS